MRKSMIVFFLCLTLILASASCSKKTESEVEVLAGEFVAKLAAGDFAGAVGYYDTKMKEVLPEDKLKETWQAVLAQVGSYKSVTEKKTQKIQGYDAVFVTTQFEKAKINIRVVFDSDKKVAGLFFEPA